MLGVPSEVYQYGSQYAACIFTSFISCLIIVLVYLPVFYKLQLTSTFEYLEIRFARPVRQLASFLYTLSLIVYVPLIIYVPALAFSQATGLNLHFVAPVICMVCIFYTTIVSKTSNSYTSVDPFRLPPLPLCCLYTSLFLSRFMQNFTILIESCRMR